MIDGNQLAANIKEQEKKKQFDAILQWLAKYEYSLEELVEYAKEFKSSKERIQEYRTISERKLRQKRNLEQARQRKLSKPSK